MPPGLDALKHVVVLMMENRSFDHMLGSLKATNPLIDGIDGTQSNPDINGKPVFVQPLAEFQSQLDPDPNHHFPAVDLQIFGGDQSSTRVANMQGFVKSYYQQQEDVAHSQKIMYYFSADKLPVLTSLATNFAVFNRWFASIPGPTICYVLCTTCHNQHVMTVYTSSKASPIANDGGGKYYATYFFVNGPYNPGINNATNANAPSD